MSAPLLCFTAELKVMKVKVLFELPKLWHNNNIRRTIVTNVHFSSIQVEAAKEMKQPLFIFIWNI